MCIPLLTVLSLCLPPCLSQSITQSPLILLIRPGEAVSLTCSVKASGDPYMYWYRKAVGGGALTSVVSSFGKGSVEELTLPHFSANRGSEADFSLSSEAGKAEDAGTYYCAWSSSASKLEFGGGTVLSVLEDGKKKTAPKVKIFRPSRKELGDHNLLSLVCVASGFYPEHVRIMWFVDDIHRENLYHPEAQKDSKGFYSTYKRLTLARAEYFNPETKFKCVAAFLDGSEEASEYIEGETDCGVSKVKFGMSITQGKISYIMVLCKSGVYGLIVLAVLWRKKVIADS